jgi:hypothetical protein
MLALPVSGHRGAVYTSPTRRSGPASAVAGRAGKRKARNVTNAGATRSRRRMERSHADPRACQAAVARRHCAFRWAMMSFRSALDRSFGSKNGIGPGVESAASPIAEGGGPEVRTFCAMRLTV